MPYSYRIEPSESRAWFGPKRYNWRIVHTNGNIEAHSGQGYSRRIDRNTAASNFYNTACVKDVVSWAQEGWDA